MESQPGGEEGPDEEFGSNSGLPGGSGTPQPPGEPPGEASGESPRDARLAGFARGGEWDSCAPSAALAAALEGASGPEWRCPGAERDELFGLLRRAAALESWAAAGKMGLLRALMREEDLQLPGGSHHGDLPDEWSRSLTHEVSAALAMPPQSAEKLMRLAWDMAAVLPGIGGLLADGTLTYSKARAVDEALAALSDKDMARAEAMILPRLAEKTHGQVEKLAVQAAITVDPESAAKRREDAERNQAKVSLRRGQSGAVNLSGYDLPTDETLAAHAQVCARAAVYKDSGVFPDVRMDQLRAQAYLDLINGITAEARIAVGQPDTGLCAPGECTPGHPGTDVPDPHDPGSDGPGSDGPGSDGPDADGPDRDGPDGDGTSAGEPGGGDCGGAPDDNGPADDDPRGPGLGSASGSTSSPPPEPRLASSPEPRLTDLVLPLATLLGLAWRPGEGHGLGPLDPDLCRALATTAVNSPNSALCVTVTDARGYAIGHGCARPARGPQPPRRTGNGPPGALVALPARVNLSITSALLATLAARAATARPDLAGPRKPGSWSFTRSDDHGPPGSPGSPGSWELGLPDGRILIVKLEPVPTFDCDHRRESHAYKPSDALRHLVQIRDYECTFPTCSRHARESDFEHAIPYHKGGRTCGCNAGARSRQCHQVKQSPGWNVTQPRPGWHRWETPSGRVYLQEPKRYPF
jgi:hypothetical protein